MLESQNHAHTFFSTFTYAEEPYPSSLRKGHLTSFMHRLRSAARRRGIRSVRYFGVGEYGERFARPHYHAAIFGLGPDDTEFINDAWSFNDRRFGPGLGIPGTTDHRTLSPALAEYIAGYVTKKMTAKTDPRLDGREPEFAVMSRRPGIGAAALEPLIEALNTSEGALYFSRHHDVPAAFTVGGRSLPIGSHLRGLLRLFFFGESTQPKQAKDHHNRVFFKEALAQHHVFNLPETATSFDLARLLDTFSTASGLDYHQRLQQKGRQVAARHRIKTSMRKL